MIQANQSVLTDLSKLGKPGQHFVHDFFLPGTQLTFPQSQAKRIAALAGVSEVSSGLLLLAEHQEGTVPKIVATFKTGGQRQTVTGTLKPPTTRRAGADAGVLREDPRPAGRRHTADATGGGPAAAARAAAEAASARAAAAAAAATSARSPSACRRGSGTSAPTFTTPTQTLQQVLAPPQTNIKSTAYSIGGVDQTKPDIGLVTPAQVTSGRYFSTAGGREALVGTSYAASHKLKVGSKLTLNGTTFIVVGLVQPPLGGQTADVYLPLKQLQTLAHEPGLANVALVRASSGSSVGKVAERDHAEPRRRLGREREAGGRPDLRLARRRVESRAQPRSRARHRRRRAPRSSSPSC